MNENEIEKELMDWWIGLSANIKSKDKYIETAEKLDKLSE